MRIPRIKTILTAILIAILFGIIVLLLINRNLEAANTRLRCAEFATQPQAQAFYNSARINQLINPNIWKQAKLLDRNHDGVACQDNPK